VGMLYIRLGRHEFNTHIDFHPWTVIWNKEQIMTPILEAL